MSAHHTPTHDAASSGSGTARAAALTAWALLAVRFVQGWIYWGGGSRRFIYAPQKLDPHAASWMANKLQTAMPGALLGTGSIVAYLLHHFTLLYGALVVFSAFELLFGLFLILGFMTRLSALVTAGLSVALMLMFGWQGATCIDEWTMASANFAMGVTLFMTGAAALSVDAWIMKRWPAVVGRPWFQWFGSAPWDERRTRRWGTAGAILTVLFVGLTYNYYRGSIVTPFHGGPVSPAKHALRLSDGTLSRDGRVRFRAYVDAGTAAEPSNIVAVSLISPNGQTVERWTSEALRTLPSKNIDNIFRYNRFVHGYVGLSAKVGAEAMITLPASPPGTLEPGRYTLIVRTVNGHRFTLPLERHPTPPPT
jgi:uncharacterized membrane protein YphA (DoxX/SURF4 family)